MALIRKLIAVLRRQRLDVDMREEMRAHLDEQTRRNLAAGMSETDARAAAHRQFGSVAQIQERARDARNFGWVEDLVRDSAFAARTLRKNRGFAVAVVISLALCLGANAGIFSLLHTLVLRPLPFREAGRIVEVYNTFPKVGIARFASNLGQYFDFRANAPAFAHVGLWRLDQYILGDETAPARIAGAYATAEMFDVLGLQPRLGRFFTAANHVPAADKVVVLTESFWESQFQRDPGVLGRTIQLDDVTYEIIGVAPRLLEAFDARARVLRPMSWAPDQQFGRTGYSPSLFARLRPGASVAQARAEVAALEKQYHDTAPAQTRDFLDRTGQAARVDTVASQRAAPVRTAMFLLQGGALFVLLIGCLNVTNLLLSRANVRRGEFAMRAALGASRVAIARQLVVESSLLTAVGAAAGIAVAWGGLQVANRYVAEFLPHTLPVSLNIPVFGYAAALTLVVGGLTGLLPTIHALRGLEQNARLQGGRSTSAARSTRAMSGALVVTQVAFALVLLTGAGLLMRSFAKVLATDPGFAPDHVFAASLAVPKEREKSFPPRLDAALRAIPDFAVGLATATPYFSPNDVPVSMPLGGLSVRDHALPADAAQPSVYFCGVTPSYRDVLKIPLRAGRWFSDADLQDGRAVVVDETFVRRYFPDGQAVGRKIMVNRRPPAQEDEWQEIIGVAANVRHNGLEDRSGQPFVYQPLTQVSFHGVMSVFIRTSRPAAETLALLRETVREVDPSLPIFRAGPLAGVISDSFDQRRGVMFLLGGFAGLALVLSAVGIYGVLAYDVAQRTREIGIRGALGATRGQIAALVLRQGLKKTALGLSAGLLLAAGLSRYLTALLYDVSPHDPGAYATVLVVMLLTATLASWLPARRAARVDPLIALRAE